MIALFYLISIIHLYTICTFNLQPYSTFSTSTDWFIHPYSGGTCVFGQLVGLLTSIILLVLLYTNCYHFLLPWLGWGWVIGSYLMNNTWLSIQSIPLCILWNSMYIYHQ